MITLLSSGLGQDSTALLLLAIFNADFRKKYVKGDLIVAHSDTQNEHRETYEFLEETRELCKTWDIPFFHVTADNGYHSPKWAAGLVGQMERLGIIFSRNMRSCSIELKIKPLYRFTDVLVGERYGFTSGRKRGLKAYRSTFGQMDVWIGFTADERHRAERAERERQQTFAFAEQGKVRDKWMAECINRVYPLIDLGWTREDCQRYIRDCGVTSMPAPSLCKLCPHKGPELILWTALNLPDEFALWQRLEDEKIRRHAGRVDKKGNPIPNHGVHPGVRLTDTVNATRAKYKHLTDAQLRTMLNEFRMTNGHCGTAF